MGDAITVENWPVYINDYWAVTCNMDGCQDGDLDHPGRRCKASEIFDAIREHARVQHNIILPQ